MGCCKSLISFENCVVDGKFSVDNFIEDNKAVLHPESVEAIRELASKYKIVGFDYDFDIDILSLDYKDPEAFKFGCDPYGKAFLFIGK